MGLERGLHAVFRAKRLRDPQLSVQHALSLSFSEIISCWTNPAVTHTHTHSDTHTLRHTHSDTLRHTHSDTNTQTHTLSTVGRK